MNGEDNFQTVWQAVCYTLSRSRAGRRMAGRSVSSRNRCPRKQSVHRVTACVRAKVWASLLKGHVMPKKRGHWYKCLPQRCQKAVGDARLPLKTVRDLGAWNSLELICMRMNLLFTSLFLSLKRYILFYRIIIEGQEEKSNEEWCYW